MCIRNNIIPSVIAVDFKLINFVPYFQHLYLKSKAIGSRHVKLQSN